MITFITIDKMRSDEFRRIFEKRPLFSFKEASAVIGSETYTKIYIQRLKNRGSIHSIRRGLFSFHDDPMIYATHVQYPSYISFISAFQHYGTTTQIPVKIQVASFNDVSLSNVNIHRIEDISGYRKVRYLDFEIFMAELEKAVIDSIVTETAPLDEIINAVRECREDRIKNLIGRLSTSDLKRVGYVLDLAGIHLADVLVKIKKDRNYVSSVFHQGKNDWRVLNDRY